MLKSLVEQAVEAFGGQEDGMFNPDGDPDDTAYLADGELGDAPADPGTYEGECAKPTDYDDPTRQNKWCCRECERSRIYDAGAVVELSDFSRRVYNQPATDRPGHGGPAADPWTQTTPFSRKDLTLAKTSAAKSTERPVIVTTEHRGVFYGWATDTSGDRIHLKRARMAIYWGTTRGLMELCETGPTDKSRLSARADLEVRKITAVFAVTPEAAKAWEEHS